MLDPLWEIIPPAQAAVAVGVMALIWIAVKILKGGKGPDYLEEVRSLAALGELGKAGEIQLNHGNTQEAYNLFLRGGLEDKCSICAERLGRLEKAADHAHKDGNLERAANLLEQVGRHAEAAKLFEKAGLQRKSALAAAKDRTATPEQLAQHWE